MPENSRCRCRWHRQAVRVRPLFTSVLRFDSYEANDGRDKISAWTPGVSYFLRENVKLRAEFSTRDGDGAIEDDDRFTIQIDAFFWTGSAIPVSVAIPIYNASISLGKWKH